MNLVQEKNNLFESYRNSKNNNKVSEEVEISQKTHLFNEIEVSKLNYYFRITKNLKYIQESSKAYRALLKRFLDKKKMSLIPPLFHGNEYVIDFKKKAELFNSIFATQYSLKSNTSEVSFNLHYTTEKRLDAVNCSTNDIDEIIQNLDANKAHGHNKLSTRMTEICSKSICKPLELMLNRHTNTSPFPLVEKEGDKQYLKNNSVVSQNPIPEKTWHIS